MADSAFCSSHGASSPDHKIAELETQLSLPETYADGQKFAALDAEYRALQQQHQTAEAAYEKMFEELMAVEEKIG